MNGMTPLCMLLVIILCASILFVSKKYMIVPFIVGMCFIPSDKSIQIASLDFQVLRIIALFSLLRVSTDNSIRNVRINTIDRLFFSYHILGAIIYIIASTNLLATSIYKCGQLVDSIAIYLTFRSIIQNKETILAASKTLALCILFLTPFTIYEYFAATNLFSILGRESIAMRDGEIRAACTFNHSILFGSFAASCFPIIWGYYSQNKNKFYIIHIISAIFFVIASSSSGPLASLLLAIIILILFRWKIHIKKFYYLFIILMLFIHFAREKPIWHFIFIRLSLKSSSTGYHRYNLIEAAIKEFDKWWLFGYGNRGPDWHTKYWSWASADFTDVTNHYLLEGVRGGFFTMALFIILCYISIKSLGSYAIHKTTSQEQWFWWGWTVALIAHCSSMLSVGYWGQITMFLYLNFAVASYVYGETPMLPHYKLQDK